MALDPHFPCHRRFLGAGRGTVGECLPSARPGAPTPGTAESNLPRKQTLDRRERRWLARRPVRLALYLIVAGMMGVAGLSSRARHTIDLTHPAPEPVRFVKEFALRDAHGLLHSRGEWRGRKAIVLMSHALGSPASCREAAELEHLVKRYGPSGVAFYGLVSDLEATPERVAEHASKLSLTFPLLLDPEQVVLSQAGLRAAPEAALLDLEGQVLYSGRIDNRPASGSDRRNVARAYQLQDAIDAVLAGEMPAVLRTQPAGGTRLAPSPETLAKEATYTRDVAPILWRNCAPCHRRGEVAPFPLLTYRDAAKRAQFLSEVVESRRMPPWKAQPGYGVFRDCLLLTERERQAIAAWAGAGAPEGNPADLPPPPVFPTGWSLGEPDLVFRMPEPYRVESDGEDDFRAFVIPIPLACDQHVVAFEFRPGNRRVVHHAKLFCDPSGRSHQRDVADPAPGFASLGSADIGQPAIWEWTPGTVPRFPPEHAGWILKAHSDLVLFVHYHPSGRPETDQSSVGIYLSKQPLRRLIAGIPLASERIDIPPGEKRHLVTASATLPADAHAYVVMPHAHYLLREMWLKATRPDGTVLPLLWIDDWDFNWQGQYAFAQPVALPRGTRLDLVAYYDNSAENPRNPNHPPRRVRFGPASTDEMLGCHIQVIPDDPSSYPIFRKQWPSGF